MRRNTLEEIAVNDMTLFNVVFVSTQSQGTVIVVQSASKLLKP